jgi:hypothetical protein
MRDTSNRLRHKFFPAIIRIFRTGFKGQRPFQILLASICIAQLAYAIDESGVDTFYLNRVAEMKRTFIECTGDTNAPEGAKLLGWKNSLNDWMTSPQYKESFQRYKKETGVTDDSIPPCVIFKWELVRKGGMVKEHAEDSVALVRRRKIVDDSLFMVDQLKHHPASRLDFDKIPFGVSKRGFLLLFGRSHSEPVRDDYDRLVVDNIVLRGIPYDLGFYFGSNDSLQWYEIETPSFHADSLDCSVRPLADSIAAIIEEKLGPAEHIFRIGFFDIVQNRLSLYKTWMNEHHEVYVGLATYKYRYYARAVIRGM